MTWYNPFTWFQPEPFKRWDSRDITFGFRVGSGGDSSELNKEHKEVFIAAAQEWTDKTCINLIESSNPKIFVSMRGFEGSKIGFGYFPSNNDSLAGDIDFDSTNRQWSDSLFYKVALHELGHSCGLRHSRSPLSIMYRKITSVDSLHSFDIKNMNKLYKDKNNLNEGN